MWSNEGQEGTRRGGTNGGRRQQARASNHRDEEDNAANVPKHLWHRINYLLDDAVEHANDHVRRSISCLEEIEEILGRDDFSTLWLPKVVSNILKKLEAILMDRLVIRIT